MTTKTRNRRQGSKAPAATATVPVGGWQLRPTSPQGPYTNTFAEFWNTRNRARFYEFLVSAIPLLDTAVGKMNDIDGYFDIEGDNAALVEDLRDWFFNVPVNDFERGVNAFLRALSREAHEQGFGFAEPVFTRKRDDIERLIVADSKSITSKREATGLFVYQRGLGDQQPRQLDISKLYALTFHTEDGSSFGVPLARSLETFGQLYATIVNALQNVWERFGDPSFSIIYKTTNYDKDERGKRKKQLEEEFTAAIRAKREGKSADFIKVLDERSTVEIKVIGADGQELTFEAPWRAVAEQIVVKTGLPPWSLGLRWAATQGMSGAEEELMLAASETRNEAKSPIVYNLIRTRLLLQGRTWKPGDWKIRVIQPNLRNVEALARARFMNAQADMYERQNQGEISTPQNGKSSHGDTCDCQGTKALVEGVKELQRTEPWTELDTVEAGYEGSLKGFWQEFGRAVASILRLPKAKDFKGDMPDPERFSMDEQQKAALLKAMEDRLGEFVPESPDSPLRWYYGQSYSLGVLRAAQILGKERPLLDIVRSKEIYEDLCNNGFQMVKDGATRELQNKIIPAMEAQALAGTNPTHVARELERLFGNGNSNWERLARSEMTMAAERAKIDEWKEWKVDVKNATVPVLNTHPRCRCANTVKKEGGTMVIRFVPAPDACSICRALAQ